LNLTRGGRPVEKGETMDFISLIAVLFLMIIFILILAVLGAEISYVLEEYR
jgi:hypothetical protein